MRLLQRLSGGDFELTSFEDDQLPPYAILSHTWAEGQEVTYHDLVAGINKEKTGFKKIVFCGEQAAADGLRYFWVDTCCIDKSNNNELNTSINSMFRWYQLATKCYVYLSDVSVPDGVLDARITWSEAFRQSRWFTRGWTLQELLAPANVDFFSQEGTRLGNKISLEQDIHQITKIPVEMLRGRRRLTEFSVDERMSWASARKTTLKEDKIYCLLGIFQVFLPLIYGEGEDHATLRLKEEIYKRHEGHRTQQTSDGNHTAGLDTPSHLFSAPTFSRDEALWIVPFQKNTQFVGRAREIAQITALLTNQSRCERVAIDGLGGIGKTQIALEFAHRWREQHSDCAVFWIPVTNIDSMLEAYLEIGQQLQIPNVEQEKSNVQKLVQRKLSQESSGRWLLVFDNADDIDMWTEKTSSATGSSRQIDFLPKSKHGSILFTTRSRKAATKLAGKNLVFVGEMDDATAKGLLQKSLINQDLLEDEQASADLLLKLTNLPLAIVQAAAYVNENEISLAEYAMLLDDSEQNIIDILSEEFEDEGRYADIKNPIATTWLISFEQIQKRDPLAAEYLSFMSCVAPKDVPRSLLPPAESAKKAVDAIGTLSAYSFVTKHKEGQLLDLHRLVHLATRNWLRTEGILRLWTTKALQRLAEVFPSSDYQNRKMWRMYLPHAKYVLTSDLEDDAGEVKIDLLWKFGNCTERDGRYRDAEMAYTKVTETKKRMFGQEYPGTLTSARTRKIKESAWTRASRHVDRHAQPSVDVP
ncbi:P-loop containing nucleoside triphosphate hydrolase protein [Pyrenochaeta sp. MPI-SDFR-AT-0127]|nr:P-loop containing nucleoside triphosphate hydrolase protein [Pyrenochaeta sp. MPI-SDFR-AT-0127]